MDTQIKKLTMIVNHVSKKLEVFENSTLFDYKQYSDLTLELNQINAEAALLIQQAINIDVSLLFEKIFSCLHNIIQHAIKSKLHSQKIHNKSQSLQVEQCIQCINASLSQKVFGGVSVSKQGNPNMKVKESSQVPWYDTSLASNSQQQKIDKYTCTTEDYYFNCYKVSSESIERQVEFENMVQFANESIAIMGEALSSRVLQTYKEKGKPEELNKLVHTIKFKKDDIDQVIKSIDLELLKDKIENYDKIEEQVRQHILQVQKQTAEKVFLYCKSLYKEKIKRGRNYSQDAILRQQTLAKMDECRCQLYIGEILSLQNKTEQQQQLVQKQIADLKDKERIIQGMELQQKILDGQIKTHIQEKQELKQKLEQQNNQIGLSRRSTVFQRQSSFLINQNDDQEGMSPSGRRISREEKPPQSRMYRSQILQPFTAQPIPAEQINTDQISDLLKKDQLLERLIILTNALDRNNKDKRLSQLQYVVEQKGERQLIDMFDLIKDIEENDLLMLESKSYGKSQNDIDDAKSPINLPKQYHSQHIIDNREAPPKLKFQSSRDLNSPKTSLLEQIREIDENKHILLIPIEQDQNKRKQSKNTSHSSFNSSNHVIDESPENKKSETQKQRVQRTSSNAQQSQEFKNGKMKRTSSIKLKINRKTSSQINKSNDLLSNPYGAGSTILPQNSVSLTDRFQQNSGLHEDQFKFEKALDTDEHNRSGQNNHSQHEKTYTNQIQSNLTTQHHTPNNSSRTYKLKAYNQNSDKYENIPFKQISNSKDISQPKQYSSQKQLKQDVESTMQNLQQTKFQQIKQQQKEGFQVENESNQPHKQQSKATHQSNEINQQTSKQKTGQEISQIIITETRQKLKSGQNIRSPNSEIDELNPNPIRKMSKGNRSPEQNIKTQTNDQVSSSTFRQQFLEKLHASCEKQQSKTHRTQTSGDNQEGKSSQQDGFIKDYIGKQKEEYERKLKEERTMFEQNLFEIGEQQEELIIKNAMNNKQGYIIAQDIDDTIMKQMFKNLKDQGSQITQTINKFYQKGEHQAIDYTQFHNFINKFLNMHKRCGKDCIHVTRFYMRLGFVPVKYLNKRKAMKLSKPVVLPGFPKV